MVRQRHCWAKLWSRVRCQPLQATRKGPVVLLLHFAQQRFLLKSTFGNLQRLHRFEELGHGDLEDHPVGCVLCEDQLFAFESLGLVNLKVSELPPFESVMHFLDVIVLAMDANEVVYIDHHHGNDLTFIVVFEEEHTIPSMADIVELGQDLHNVLCPKVGGVGKPIDVSGHLI